MKPNKKRSYSTISRTFVSIIAFLFAANFFVLLALTYDLSTDIKADNTQALSGQQEQLTEKLAETLDEEISSTFAKLEILAQHPGIKTLDADVCNQTVQTVFDNFSEGTLDSLSRMNAEGTFYCSLSESSIGFDGTTLDYLREIIADPLHRPVVADLTQNSTDGSIIFTALHQPIFNEDGVFTGTVGTAWFFNDFGDEFFSDVEGYNVVLVDQNNTILYSSDSSKLNTKFAYELGGKFNDEQIVVNQTALEQATVEVAANKYWKVVTLRSVENNANLFASVSLPFIYISVGSTLIGIFLLITFASRLYFKPLRSLTKTINKISVGDYNISGETKSLTANPELEDLSKSFIGMAERIKENEANLERKVEVRTKELEEATSKLEQQLKESERSNKLMVGRELKMVELKKQIQDLQDKIEK